MFTCNNNGDGSISLGDAFGMGGWLMVPLAIMLLLAILLFIERYIAIRNASKLIRIS